MKKKMLLTIVAVFCVAMFGVSSANAGYIPYEMGDIGDYLNNSAYFNGVPSAINPPLTFTGNWQYTAIAFEAGNVNITENAASGPTTFSTSDLSNWGTWKDVNFSTGNIYFSDKTNGPYDIAFNPYRPEESARFKLFQLTADSESLGYLSVENHSLVTPLILSNGTYIIGWNDNLNDGVLQDNKDTDYDDIIIAMRPVQSVPEPTTMLLLGLGLVGLAGMSRRFKK